MIKYIYPAVNDASLVADWDFSKSTGDTLYDKSKSKNHATFVNGPVWSKTASGKGCILFDGTNDYLTINNTNLPYGSSARTVIIRFKFNSTALQELFGYGQNAPGQRFGVMLYNNDLYVESADRHGGFTWGYDTDEHELAIVMPEGSTTGNLQFYLDGIRRSTNLVIDAALNTTAGSSGQLIGALPDLPSAQPYPTNGYISKLKIFNRALSDNEVYREFNTSLINLYIDVSTAITGTLSTTNANDTLAASGTTTVTGTLAKTNTNDTLAASGTTTVTGTLAKTNANDTLAASGTTAITGTLSTTNANDTLAASGSTAITGTLSTTNANDTLAASGSTAITGTLSTTNANDTLAASGSVGDAVSGTVAYTNINDSVIATGTTKIIGILTKTELSDTSSANGTTTVIGTVTKTNDNDTCAAFGYMPVSGTLAYTNINDSLVASGIVTGAVTLTDQDLIDIANAVWTHSSAIHCQLLMNEVWGRLGLDPSSPLTSGTTQITFGAIVMAMTEISGSVTVTRQ